MDDAQDQLEFHHKQLAMRAVGRLEEAMKKVPPTDDPEEGARLRATMQPIDVLCILYNLHYADRTVEKSRKVVDLVNACSLRASHPALFDWLPLEPFLSALSPEQREELCRDVEDVLSSVRALESCAPKDTRDDEGNESSAAAEVAALVDCNAMWAQVVRYLRCLEHAATIDQQTNVVEYYEGQLLELIEKGRAHLGQLAAELHALAALDDSDSTNPPVYKLAYSMCLVQQAQHDLEAFEETARQFALEIPKHLVEEFRKAQALRAAMSGQAENYSITELEALQAMAREGEALRDDEELFKDELLQYIPLREVADFGDKALAASGPVRERLKKPFRFSKIKTSYVWNQYNKTHYDTKTSPPPKQVRSYEFTLYYPEIAADMKRKPEFRVEPTAKGWSDEFVIIVFRAGPPYSDVAYRIVNKRWDSRPGGVNCSFDDKGKFRLYFRVTDGGYRR